jgi:hypothetical protein
MSGADYLFAIILLTSCVLGAVRGFIREAISLLTWLVGLWIAWHYAHLVDPWLGGALAEPGVREWTGRAAVLLVVLVGAAIGNITVYFLRAHPGTRATDRLLGALFGLMRRGHDRAAGDRRPRSRSRPRAVVGQETVDAGGGGDRQLAGAIRAAGRDRTVREGDGKAR